LLNDFGSREEIIATIQRDSRAVCHELHAMLAGDIGEPPRDVRPTGKHHRFDLGADGRERSADIVGAIEKSGEAGVGNCLAGRVDH